nr:hypothetical protein [Desulfobulbaceae bacterium]
MPASAISTGLVDYILPPDKMPAQLLKYTSHILKKQLSRLDTETIAKLTGGHYDQ